MAEKAILAGMRFAADAGFDKSMREMKALAEAAGMEVADTFVQDGSAVNPGTYIGSGKIQEIRAAAEMEQADVILFNNTLTPMQMKNLVDALDREIIDRTALILRIFAERAGTREARLQVESANLQYMLPRLAGLHKELGRQGGASGALSNKGAGETRIELDRRRIEHRIAALRGELEVVERERMTQRKRRNASGIPLVALVGYTNAGKSTILNRMLDAYGTEEDKKVLEQDMLFATLDTTVRSIRPDGGRRPFLLSDTVGFISNLPTTLVKAFRSTLDEVKYADILCIVSDVSDPEYREDLKITVDTLKEIGAGEIPRVYVFNKADAAGLSFRGGWFDVNVQGITAEDGRLTMSAKNPDDISRLVDLIENKVNAGRTECTLLIPYTEGRVLTDLMHSSDVKVKEYTAEGTLVHGFLRREDRERYSRFEH